MRGSNFLFSALFLASLSPLEREKLAEKNGTPQF
jgi:hypothetical protein